jgi:hypothetical protein
MTQFSGPRLNNVVICHFVTGQRCALQQQKGKPQQPSAQQKAGAKKPQPAPTNKQAANTRQPAGGKPATANKPAATNKPPPAKAAANEKTSQKRPAPEPAADGDVCNVAPMVDLLNIERFVFMCLAQPVSEGKTSVGGRQA